ncbi:MAG: energy transducer TonB [Gammaproteobacteria bacterium]|nr:energy transducer TonB [Gammaproteobacteria bacterium]
MDGATITPMSMRSTIPVFRRMLLGSALLWLAGCAGNDRPLQLVSGTGAIYPPDAKEEGVEGYVVVRYDVNAEGRVHNARVVAAEPPEVFNESALQAVSRWRFRPPERDGEAQPVSGLESRLEFTLSGGSAYEDY